VPAKGERGLICTGTQALGHGRQAPLTAAHAILEAVVRARRHQYEGRSSQQTRCKGAAREILRNGALRGRKRWAAGGGAVRGAEGVCRGRLVVGAVGEEEGRDREESEDVSAAWAWLKKCWFATLDGRRTPDR
jgi:hypothetical protein